MTGFTKVTPITFAALMLGNLLLSIGPVFVRSADVGPVAAGFWRIALAVPILFTIAARKDRRALRPGKALLGLFAVSGAFFALDLGAWHVGIHLTKLTNSNLLANSTSFLLPIWSFAVARRWPNQEQGIAILLAGLGAGLLMGRSFEISSENLRGDFLSFLGGVCYTGYLIVMMLARGNNSPWMTLAWSSLMSAAPLLLFAALMGEHIVPTDWRPLIALALCSQVAGQALMISTVSKVSPLLFGVSLLAQPLIAGAIGWVRYGERLTAPDFAGAALIAVAMLLIRRNEAQRPIGTSLLPDDASQ